MAQDSFPDFERETAALAHQYWEEEGWPENRAVQHWERAERELRRREGESAMPDSSSGGIANDTGASGKMG